MLLEVRLRSLHCRRGTIIQAALAQAEWELLGGPLLGTDAIPPGYRRGEQRSLERRVVKVHLCSRRMLGNQNRYRKQPFLKDTALACTPAMASLFSSLSPNCAIGDYLCFSESPV